MQIISNIVACVQAKAHCIRANVEHDSLDTAVVLTLLLMDIGWVLGHPMLALPTLVLGLSLQSMVLYFSVQGFVFYRRKGDPDALLLPEFAMVTWIISNTCWMCAEFLWEESHPVGALGLVKSLEKLPEQGQTDSLTVASVLLWFAVMVLVIYYCISLGNSSRRCSLSLHQYRYLWWLPWTLNEACWVSSDLKLVKGVESFRWEVPTGLFAGAIACVLCFDCTRRLWVEDQAQAALHSAELFWVLGNMTWWIGDELDSLWSSTEAAWLFFVGCLVALSSLAVGERGATPCPEVLPSVFGIVDVSLDLEKLPDVTGWDSPTGCATLPPYPTKKLEVDKSSTTLECQSSSQVCAPTIHYVG